jgi:hypothetical protein
LQAPLSLNDKAKTPLAQSRYEHSGGDENEIIFDEKEEISRSVLDRDYQEEKNEYDLMIAK